MTYKILVVDDDDAVRNFIAGVFSRENSNVSQASNGVKALEVLAQQSVDLVVTDKDMPQMDGIELIRQAKQLYPCTKYVILSGNWEGGKSKAMDAGADELYQKPVSVSKLMEIVRKYCNGSPN